MTDKKHQRALLSYQAGQHVREIFRQLPDTGEDDDFDTAVTKLTSHFESQKNKLFEVYTFRKAVEGSNETPPCNTTPETLTPHFFLLTPEKLLLTPEIFGNSLTPEKIF